MIRSEPFAGYSLPQGASAIRILYHSRALNGEDIAASGVVLIPAGAPPAGGWPVIAWAHGTSGVARMCAPSHDAETFDPVTDLYWPFTAFGIKASYPTFDIKRMLTPPLLARYKDVTTKGCWYYAYAALKEIGEQRAVKPGWDRASEAHRYNQDSKSANKPIRGPLLVLAGDDDKSVAIANIAAGVNEACKIGLAIEYVHHPGLDHDPLMQKTTPEQLAWVRDRLAGKPWTSNCDAL